MGIGVDDIFVFHENWVNAGSIQVLKLKLAHRLTFTFRKAQSALLITSITTVVSFLFTCMCTILPLVSFGLFAALVVFVNYCMTMLILPCIYLFYIKHVSWIGAKVKAIKAKKDKVVDKIKRDISECKRATLDRAEKGIDKIKMKVKERSILKAKCFRGDPEDLS